VSEFTSKLRDCVFWTTLALFKNCKSIENNNWDGMEPRLLY
jgi:hypothetical protein